MDDPSIKQQVLEFLTTNFLFDNTLIILENDSLLEAGIIDSTGVLELIAFIERTYGITANDDELIPENLDTICNIDSFIQRKIAQKQKAAAG